MCQVTYDNFINTEEKLAAFVADYPELARKRAESVLGPYALGTFLFKPGEVMRRPPGLQPGQVPSPRALCTCATYALT